MQILDYFQEKIRPIKKATLNLLLPPLCPLCRKPIAEAEGLCVLCWRELIFIEEPYCKKSGLPFIYEQGEEVVSKEALEFPPVFQEARAALLYNATSAKLIRGFKYSDRVELTPLLSRFMMNAGRNLIEKADVLIPIPLHYRRFLGRRYNQSAELTRFIAKATGKEMQLAAMKRIKKTRKQVGLSQFERLHNLDDAFSVIDPLAINGKAVLLIDDVMTTGTTLNSASKELLQQGAKCVYVLTIAKVSLESSDF